MYNERVLDEIEKLRSFNDRIILLGDLNYNYLVKDQANPNFMNQMEYNFCMKQLVNEPTRESLTGSSLIDVILTSVPEQHIRSHVLKVSMSDHYCIQTILRNVRKVDAGHNLVTFCDYKAFVKEDFLAEMASTFAEFPGMSNNIHDLWDDFKSKFLHICRKHVLIVTRRLRNRYNPWVTLDIIKMMYDRDYLKRKAVKTKCQRMWNDYKKLRNRITYMIRKRKKQYFHDENLRCSNNPKEVWKLLNKVLNNKGTETPPSELTANEFNEYFSTIGENTAKEYYTRCSDGSHPWKGPDFTTSKFKFEEANISLVLKLLEGLGKDSNCDVLGFDSKLLFMSAEIMAPCITKLINISLNDGIVVDDNEHAAAKRRAGRAADLKLLRVLPVVGLEFADQNGQKISRFQPFKQEATPRLSFAMRSQAVTDRLCSPGQQSCQG